MNQNNKEKVDNLESKKEVLNEKKNKLIEKKEKINEEIKTIDIKIESVESEIALQKMIVADNLLEGTGIDFKDIINAIKQRNFNYIEDKIKQVECTGETNSSNV